LLPASSQTSESSKRWRPPAHAPSRPHATHFADWSIVIVLNHLGDPSARNQPRAKLGVSAAVSACVPLKHPTAAAPCSSTIDLKRAAISRIACMTGIGSCTPDATRLCDSPRRSGSE
jgi:hypothetical protein